MPAAAPRIHPALVTALRRLDRRDRPIAETHRRLGELADLIGLTRPSYEQTRVLVHTLRLRGLDPGAGEVLLTVLLSPAPGIALDRLAREAQRERERWP